MQTYQPNIFVDRDDTFFGICEAIGEDFRIPANLLRVGLALVLFFNPLAALAAYAGLGVLVFVSRWFAPNPQPAIREVEAEPVIEHEPQPALAQAA
jgi:phage shock protein C